MPLEWFLAVRFLREGRVQTALIVAGASFGVLLVVFLSALMAGLQQDLLNKTLGAQPHVVLRTPDEQARPLRSPGHGAESGELVAARVERPTQRLRAISDWLRVLEEAGRTPGVSAASPTATGPALATRGGANNAVTLIGIVPERFRSIYDIDRRVKSGRFDLSGDRILIGKDLAIDLGVVVGDKIRLDGGPGRDDIGTVAGVFDLGVRDVNRRWVILSLRRAQTLLDLPGGISQIELRVSDVFAASELAHTLSGRTGLKAEAWTDSNTELLAGLSAQSASSRLIQLFVILGVAVAIASVLVISVVQKQRQIGILRAIGAPRGRILRVFLIQGGLVGLLGSIFGGALGGAMVRVFASTGSFTFPVTLDAPLFLRATLIAVGTGLLASVLPARRAAHLQPAEAIRSE